MAKLTKRDIVVAISNQTGMVQHEVFEVVQRTLDHITDSLAKNVAVELRNFGVFEVRRLLTDLPGTDAVTATAWGPRGLVCRAAGTLPDA